MLGFAGSRRTTIPGAKMAGEAAEVERLSGRYQAFAIEEARGSSEIYERPAGGFRIAPD
jgi:hypothetical protein